MAGGAPAAAVAATRQALAQRLAAWPGNDGAMTWALVVVNGVPTAGQLAAARQAGTLCDGVVALRLPAGAPVAPQFDETLRAWGVDVVWVPRAAEGPLRADAGVDDPLLGKDAATLAVQAVATVLPNLVVASRGDIPAVRLMRNLLAGLGDMFVLRVCD